MLEEVRKVETLFSHATTEVLDISDSVKVQAADLALAKKAPFHKNKNSMADALIIISTIQFASSTEPNTCIFVSNNTDDFSSDESKNEIHIDLKEMFAEYKVSYSINIGLALNQIENNIVDDEEIREIEQERILNVFSEKMQEFSNRSRYPMSAFAETMADLQSSASIAAAAFQSQLQVGGIAEALANSTSIAAAAFQSQLQVGGIAEALANSASIAAAARQSQLQVGGIAEALANSASIAAAALQSQLQVGGIAGAMADLQSTAATMAAAFQSQLQNEFIRQTIDLNNIANQNIQEALKVNNQGSKASIQSAPQHKLLKATNSKKSKRAKKSP